MEERSGVITMKGEPLTLLGKEVKSGDKAAEVILIDNNLSPVKLSDFKGKILVLSSVPSLDTPVCDIETRRFNQEAIKLGEEVVILTISRDLPFAQKRWCGANGIKNIQTLSDYQEAAFGKAYGVLIKELKLLARAIFVVDQEGLVRYVQLVKELTEEPNYEAVLKAIKDIKEGR